MNEPDGSVRLVAQGPDAAVSALEDWCRTGPPGAIVGQVQVSVLDTREVFPEFGIRR